MAGLAPGGCRFLSSDHLACQATPMDNFCFCLQATADPSVISCLHNLSRRIAIVLQHEERRCQYLTREAKLILAIQDEVSAMSESKLQAVYGLIHLGVRF